VKRLVDAARAWLETPMPVARLEIVRVLAPLAILGFMSGRLVHADEWIGDAGWRVPRLADSVFQPVYLPALPTAAAWCVVSVMVLSGVATSIGWKTRASALVFAATLVFVALSDRLAAFTVSKIGPVIVLAVACGPSGSHFGVDSWRRRQRGEPASPLAAPLPPVRFLQAMLVSFYSASGIAKAGGDWLTTPFVLWSHLHDSYQTAISFFLAKTLPASVWTPMQYLVLVFEVFAPLWFAVRQTRLLAVLFACGMHVGIGLMFGPVIWFALLMIVLVTACFMPASWLERAPVAASRLSAE
jgi:uncharacterized membrane protein YphA (DoxX/SURF4 family)